MLISVGNALKQNGCKVILIAGYKKKKDRVYQDKLENFADMIFWCSEEGKSLPHRKQDFVTEGNVIDGLKLAHNNSVLTDTHYVYCLGSDQMMHAVSKKKEEYFNKQVRMTCSLNLPMQCLMKGICGQCIQKVNDERGYIFACSNQNQDSSLIDYKVLEQRHLLNSTWEKIKSTHQK